MGKKLFWNRVAWVYDIFGVLINKKANLEIRKIVAGKITGSDQVLECACGTGIVSEAIAPTCQSLVATDIAEKMLNKARKKCAKYKQVEFKIGDIMKIEAEDNCFDKVVAANVIHLLPEPLLAIKEMYRVCKKGGKIIIPTYINKKERGDVSLLSKLFERAGAGFQRQFTFQSYRNFFQDAGYKDVEYTIIKGRVPCAVATIQK